MNEEALSIDDYGLVIGLISTPNKDKHTEIEDSVKEFYDKEIRHNLSEVYSRQREGNCIREEELLDKDPSKKIEDLYNPIAFRMFSDYDIVVLTLMDDLSYPYRVFNPSHGSRDEGDNTYYNYDYQIMTCLNTLPYRHNHLRLNSMMTEQRDKKYPYICITRAHLNSNFLVGNGMDYIELIKNTIREETITYNRKKRSEKNLPDDIDIIKTYIFDSLGSEEMIIISFARNFSSIAESVQKTRCLLFKSLLKGNNEEDYNKVLHNPIKPNKPNEEKVKWDNCHVFCSTYSLTGYSFDLVENFKDYKIVNEDEDKRIEIVFDWDIKPGHPRHFKKQFKDEMEGFKKTYTGFTYNENEDFMRIEHNHGNYVRCIPTTISDLEGSFERIEKLRILGKDKTHIRKLHLSMNVKFGNNEGEESVCIADEFLNSNCEDFELERHPENSLIGKKIKIKEKELSLLRNNLSKANISKMLRERVMKMYNNYNHCINDPLFVRSFIDFYGFMKFFACSIEKYANAEKDQNAEIFQHWMTDCVDGFEQAYYNRFHQSARMRNMTDFNLEWNGSLQQIISPLDCIFKEMLVQTGYEYYHKFIYISGLYGAEIRNCILRLNMLYVTYPELFATTIWKEIFNFLLTDSLRDIRDELSGFKEKEFLIKLNRGISGHEDYGTSNRVHDYLLDYLIYDKEAMTTYIADALTFLYGYHGDYKLFSYWYWKVFLQTSLYYDKAGKFDSKIFIRCLSRLLFIGLLNGEDIESLRFKPFDPSVSGLWITYFEDVLSFIRILSEILGRYDFGGCVEDYVSEVLEFDKAVAEECEKCDEEIFDRFNEGNISLLSGLDSKKYFINSLTIAFLRYVKELNDKNESSIQILIRNNEGKIDDCYKQKNVSPILSDMQGGIFCIDNEVQKCVFKARALYYRAIFHYTEKYTKKEIIYSKKLKGL